MATCTNTQGTYNCDCTADGYVIAEDGYNCADIDECDAASCLTHGVCPTCDSNLGSCTNTPGSYECDCVEGRYIIFINYFFHQK